MYRIMIVPLHTSESGHAPHRKLAEAELQFQGPLSGLTLVGFAVWDNGERGYRVSFPTRPFIAASGERRSFSLLRTVDQEDRTGYETLQREIIEAYEAARNQSAQKEDHRATNG